ncbi:hypothetical protein ACXHMN_04595 [Rhizobium sp. LEGMi12c]
MTKVYTTLNRIHQLKPWKVDWNALRDHLGKRKADNEPLDMLTVLRITELDGFLLYCQAEPDQWRAYRLLGIAFQRSGLRLPEDQWLAAELDALERYAYAAGSDEEFISISGVTNEPAFAALSRVRWELSNMPNAEKVFTEIAGRFLAKGSGPVLIWDRDRQAVSKKAA